VIELSNGISKHAAFPNDAKMAIKLVRNDEIMLSKNMVALPKNEIIWIKKLMGKLYFKNDPKLPLSDEAYLPLTKEMWVISRGTSWIEVTDLQNLAQSDLIEAGLKQFYTLLLKLIEFDEQKRQQRQQDQLLSKALSDNYTFDTALTGMAAVLESHHEQWLPHLGRYSTPLLLACRLVGDARLIPIYAPSHINGRRPSLNDIAKVSKIRIRQVALRGEWWQTDIEPFLAFVNEKQTEQNEAEKSPQPSAASASSLRGLQPVAILPAQSGKGYEILDPRTKTRTPVDEVSAATLNYFAYVFYRSLPNQALHALDLIRFGFQGLHPDMIAIAISTVIVGLLNLIIPLSISILYDYIIPDANPLALLEMAVTLLVVIFATTLLRLTRSFAFLRLQTKRDAVLQAAIWDRLLRLPTSFFSNYSAGDLTMRANGVNALRQIITGSTLATLFAGIASSFNLVLMFFFSWQLTLVAIVLIAIAVTVALVVGIVRLHYQRQLIDMEGNIYGLLFEYISGISKFRVSGTESWAFGSWATQFAEQRKLAFKAESIANGLFVFNDSYPVFAGMVIFAFLGYGLNQGRQSLSTGDFLAFYAAFGILIVASGQLTSTLTNLLRIIPIYERLKPIIKTLPEVDEAKIDPGDLIGTIEISNAVFRYQADGPPIFNGLTLNIKPGQFVALVGPSGSGKSTLFRLLLGFESLESGSIYYDHQDLKTLDLSAVRQQIGTVLQNGGLLPGTIFSNIIGTRSLTLDDAWRAADMAGLADDIEQMPMGMHTIISEGASTFSGGQRQRLMIARAIINQPRILLFDEATSALDNRTQAIVSLSLENLHATRIVIAHRLSTIMKADLICVLDEGKIVQQGTYNDLINEPGPFAQLAKRQLA
ncbi:NHLP bacteriocin export ABC transporter permease/ATPase subunit, partial [Anaerolineales bacterium HSG24]|nr:NHLP bacteriocin export ABC transporter permease/ATPase subunit [Anaerolineales bacterium HSG24]